MLDTINNFESISKSIKEQEGFARAYNLVRQLEGTPKQVLPFSYFNVFSAPGPSVSFANNQDRFFVGDITATLVTYGGGTGYISMIGLGQSPPGQHLWSANSAGIIQQPNTYSVAARSLSFDPSSITGTIVSINVIGFQFLF